MKLLKQFSTNLKMGDLVKRSDIIIPRVKQEIYYNGINGTDYPMTYEEMCDDVRCNPYCSSEKIASEQYYFSADGSISYSPKEIANIVGVELEILDEEY